MTTVVAQVSPTVAVPVRLEGAVQMAKSGLLSVTYKQKGMVKTKNQMFDPASVVAYLEDDSAGFAIVLTNEPIAQFFGKIKASNSGHTVETEAGTVYLNSGIVGTLVTLSEADEDSREARMAARAAKVKSKVKVKGEKSSKKSKGDDESPKKKKKKKNK